MTDKTTKILLAAIALGLWAHLAAPLVAKPARADDTVDRMMLSSSLMTIAGALDSIATGKCKNNKIC